MDLVWEKIHRVNPFRLTLYDRTEISEYLRKIASYRRNVCVYCLVSFKVQQNFRFSLLSQSQSWRLWKGSVHGQWAGMFLNCGSVVDSLFSFLSYSKLALRLYGCFIIFYCENQCMCIVIFIQLLLFQCMLFLAPL